MIATPRKTCGQNISSKSASRLWNALQPRPSANRAKPAADSQRGSSLLSRAAGDRRGHELRDAGDQHDGADLEGVVTPDIGEEDRHQIDRAEQSDPQAETQGATDRE